MALIDCKECGKEISSEAPACPHCGKPQKTSNKLVIVRIVGVFVGLAVFYYFNYW